MARTVAKDILRVKRECRHQLGIEMTSSTPQKNNAPQHIAAPFLTTAMQIEPHWIDYNGHLNMAYYNCLLYTSPSPRD